MDIVFVHLNTKVPKYLHSNLESHIKRFPDHRVTLILNKEVPSPRIKNLHIYQYKPKENWKMLESLYQHEKEFRGNFWLTSTARLFALDEYQESERCEILHLESDVIISKDFPFRRFSSLSLEMAYPVISDPRGVASIFYLRSRSLARKLSAHIIQEAQKDRKTTEMLILRSFFDQNSNSIQLLPIGPRIKNAYRGLPEYLWKKMSDSHTWFGGSFDGVDIGQYFFGTDPRNRRGKTLFRSDIVNGYANIEDWSLEYSEERQFVNVSTNIENDYTKLYSLHLPSKRKNLFSFNKQEKQIIHFVSKSNSKPTEKIYWSTVFESAAKSLVRRLRK